MWFVPPMVAPHSSGEVVLKAMLNKYVVMMVVHGRLDKLTGSLVFDEINDLQAKDQSGKPLILMDRSNSPPP